MAKERLDRLCPKCWDGFLMAEPWGDEGDTREYRLTCSNFLKCDFLRHIHELLTNLVDGKLSSERVDFLLSEGGKDDAA